MSEKLSSNRKGSRAVIIGVVTKCSSAKTVAVTVSSKVKHAVFDKYETKKTKYLAHDEKGESKVGDLVKLMETKPMSKLKRFRLVEILKH